MAATTFYDGFTMTWGSTGGTTTLDSADLQQGWAYIGATPPTVEQFNTVEQQAFQRDQWLYGQIKGVTDYAGATLSATVTTTLRDAIQSMIAGADVSVGTLTAGAGLTGGGNMASNRTVAMGTPSDITSTTSSSAAGTTHTHALDNTGVTAGSYGGASAVATFTVDAKGRITAAGSAAISVPVANITGILPITKGGTGATSAADARTNLDLGNVDNTSDLAKPISTATQTALNAKQDSLGYTPVQQGGGAGQSSNKLYLGWGSGGLRLQVDGSDQGPLAMLSGANFTGPVSSTGQISAAGGFQVSSSRALKTDLRANPYGLHSVLSLETAVGRYREWFNADQRERVFLIAENMAEAVPPAVDAEGIEATPEGAHNPQKFASYSPEQLLPVLVKAIQDLHAIVQAQGERIAELEKNQ